MGPTRYEANIFPPAMMPSQRFRGRIGYSQSQSQWTYNPPSLMLNLNGEFVVTFPAEVCWLSITISIIAACSRGWPAGAFGSLRLEPSSLEAYHKAKETKESSVTT